MPSLAQSALETLMDYYWPGNVRELENTVERALILSRGESITFEDLPASISGKDMGAPVRATHLKGEDLLVLDEVVSSHIRRVLEMTGGQVGGEKGAASILEINPSTLRKKMRKLGIPFGRRAKSSNK